VDSEGWHGRAAGGTGCNALFIYLIILVEFRVFYMTYMIYVDKWHVVVY